MKKTFYDTYQPSKVESGWYEFWEKNGYFKPDETCDEKFIMVIPPPNITGKLHIGHALTNSIQDILCRWNRMNGKSVLWIPGIDHAGIATQDIVEKRLIIEEGKTRHDYTREEFINKIWDWKNKYGFEIFYQLKKLGSSLNWDMTTFTLDENYSKSVTTAFIKLYEKGLIYRDNKLVNWCCKLNTTISDIEIDLKEIEGDTLISGKDLYNHDPNKGYKFGILDNIAYKVHESDEEIIISTTRLETILGDVAIAMNPMDDRYLHLKGKYVIHPINNKMLPIIFDEFVDMNFGSGCVKITPGHDQTDYQIGIKYSLDIINIFNDDGTINYEGTEYHNLPRFECRELLRQKSFYRGYIPHKMSIPTCSRTGDFIEYMIKPQWWLKCDNMAKRAVDAVKSGDLRLMPEEPNNTEWYKWLENSRDWCISRQLWWGHRIPAYKPIINNVMIDKWYIGEKEQVFNQITQDYPDNESSIDLYQDPDVLDTWFSSSLFPFAPIGWPDNKYLKYYPNSLLETGKDILFFWVARMVMMGLELTDQLPFNKVYLHSLVKDCFGRKMAKSKGNVIDPMHIINGCSLEDLKNSLTNLPQNEIELAIKGQKKMFPNGIQECGTDALRFSLANMCGYGNEINLNIDLFVNNRHFCNKIWNVFKFCLSRWPNDYLPPTNMPEMDNIDKWIMARLAITIEEVYNGFENYNFTTSTNAILNFIWHDLSKIYIEDITKNIRNTGSKNINSQPINSYNDINDTYNINDINDSSNNIFNINCKKYDICESKLAILYIITHNYLRLLHP